jgi:autotransporter-associated beta strand protein
MIFPAGKQLRIDQSSVARPSIIPLQSTPGTLTQINSDIVDVGVGAAGAINPLTLRAGPTDLVVAGPANTYAGGTVIQATTAGPARSFGDRRPHGSCRRRRQGERGLGLTAMTNPPGRAPSERGGVELAGDWASPRSPSPS